MENNFNLLSNIAYETIQILVKEQKMYKTMKRKYAIFRDIVFNGRDKLTYGQITLRK